MLRILVGRMLEFGIDLWGQAGASGGRLMRRGSARRLLAGMANGRQSEKEQMIGYICLRRKWFPTQSL